METEGEARVRGRRKDMVDGGGGGVLGKRVEDCKRLKIRGWSRSMRLKRHLEELRLRFMHISLACKVVEIWRDTDYYGNDSKSPSLKSDRLFYGQTWYLQKRIALKRYIHARCRLSRKKKICLARTLRGNRKQDQKAPPLLESAKCSVHAYSLPTIIERSHSGGRISEYLCYSDSLCSGSPCSSHLPPIHHSILSGDDA